MSSPSNLLLNYVGRPSLYLGFFVCAWGLVSALTSQVNSYGGIVACRFILGLVGQYSSHCDVKRPANKMQRRRSSPEFCSTSPSGTPRTSSPCA